MVPVRSKKRKIWRADAVFAVIAIAAAAIMIVAGLVMRAKTAELNDVNVELNARLEELKEENIRIEIQIASEPCLDELENEARNGLGMLPPGNEQTVKIEVEKEDKAVILNSVEESTADNWISSVRNIFSNGK